MGYDELDIERQNENSKQIKIKIQRLKHSVKENNETDLERQNGLKSNAYDELDMERQNEISKEIKNEIQRLKHSYKENDESDLGRESGRQNGFDFQRFRIKKSNSIIQNAY